MEEEIRYPIGIQTFVNLLLSGYAYVDKTAFIDKLLNSGGQTFFLNRPPGFGKSLFLSTLEAYFRGRKGLFKRFAIFEKTLRWDSFPILRFDFGRAEVDSADKLERFIAGCLEDLEKEYDIRDISDTGVVSYHFGKLIESISRAKQMPVVILIDDYDHCLDPTLVADAQRQANWKVMRHFFSQIKSRGEFIHFCFITGITPLEDDNIFSSCIDPYDISNDMEYAAICGFTRNEIVDNFKTDIEALAKVYNISYEQVLERLSYKYGGYCFRDNCETVFNPTSVIKCLSKRRFDNFWINSQQDNAFGEYLLKTHYRLYQLDDLWVWSSRMNDFSSTKEIIPLLYQRGLLTIKEQSNDYYRLGIPNGEVYSALTNSLLPQFLEYSPVEFDNVMESLLSSLDIEDFGEEGNIEKFNSLISHINAHLRDKTSFINSLHQTVYTLFILLSQYVPCQVNLFKERVYMVVSINDVDYVFCFAIMGSAHNALESIDKPLDFLTWGENEAKFIKVGITLSPETFCISDYDVD